jgi:hypothetical protein
MELPPHKAPRVGNDFYGLSRLELAKLIKPVLDQIGVTWFLDAGTLLGAYRNGKQIPHDDDFDIAAYLPAFEDKDLTSLHTTIAALLPDPYQIRVVTSYARKLEIFDATSDTFELPPQYGGADFHTVTVDIQIMTDSRDGVVYLHDMLGHVLVPQDAIIPIGKIMCEEQLFNSPNDIVRFLEAQYGYIGVDAFYDSQTKFYVKLLKC